jgi:Uma2 family endonuclease
MTAEEFANIEDDSHRHELIKGELLTMPLPKYEQGRVTMNLAVLLAQHIRANNLGIVCAEAGYRLESDPDTVLGPDISFVAHGRTAVPPESYYPGPPDLAVEVLSPGDRRGRTERKLRLWLQTGTRSVWLVNPRKRTVEIISSIGERRLLHDTDELVDDTVPGFCIRVSEIFE